MAGLTPCEMPLRENDLLRCITEVSAIGMEVVAARAFDTENDHIAFVNDAFRLNFLDKVEKAIEPATLVVYRLEKPALDREIRAELGMDHEETTLAHLYELLSKQSEGERGPLLTNGYANIFYMRGNDGNLWAVYACWNVVVHGWHIYAFSVESPHKWVDGFQVVSRK